MSNRGISELRLSAGHIAPRPCAVAECAGTISDPSNPGVIPMKRVTFVLAAAIALTVAAAARQNTTALSSDSLSALVFRNIGPTIHTGRIQDVAIDPKNSSIWYVASAFGGVWKTQNRGITFEPLTNGIDSFTMC